MKKTKLWVLIACLICTCMTTTIKTKVLAANDSFVNAEQINVNTPKTDNLTSYYDKNYYKITLPADGYVSLNFSHVEQENGYNSWDVELYDANKTYIDGIDCYGDKKSTVSNNIGLPAGDYYVYVYSEHSYSNIYYQLQVSYTSSFEWETEFNDSFLTADVKAINSSICGSLMTYDDKDYYKISLPADGYVSLNFSHVEQESGYNSWDVELYDAKKRI